MNEKIEEIEEIVNEVSSSKKIMDDKTKENVEEIIEIFKKNFAIEEYKTDYTDFGKCWLHKEDKHYLCNDSDEAIFNNYRFLLTHNINNLVTHSLGKSEDGKWYGWSHRAIYGFEIGDTITKDTCSYAPDSKDNFEKSMIDWVSHDFGKDEEYGTNVVLKSILKNVPNPDGYYLYNGSQETDISSAQEFMDDRTEPTYHDADQSILGINIITRIEFSGRQEGREGYETNHWYEYPTKYGRGEYVINTEEEAKQAAIDFASSVS